MSNALSQCIQFKTADTKDNEMVIYFDYVDAIVLLWHKRYFMAYEKWNKACELIVFIAKKNMHLIVPLTPLVKDKSLTLPSYQPQ